MSEEVELHQSILLALQSELQNVKRHCDNRFEKMQQSYNLLQNKYDHIIKILLHTDQDHLEKLQKALKSEEVLNASIEPQKDGAYLSVETLVKHSDNNQSKCSTMAVLSKMEQKTMGIEIVDNSVGKILHER